MNSMIDTIQEAGNFAAFVGLLLFLLAGVVMFIIGAVMTCMEDDDDDGK